MDLRLRVAAILSRAAATRARVAGMEAKLGLLGERLDKIDFPHS